MGNILGFFLDLKEKLSNDLSDISGELVELLISYRNHIDWKIFDVIRHNMEEKLSNDLSDISGELIELFISNRNRFKKEKNWEMADAIRNDLKEMGITLKDTPEGTDWNID